MSGTAKSFTVCITHDPTYMEGELKTELKLQRVFSKPYNGGTLYLLNHTLPRKKEITVHKQLQNINKFLKFSSKPLFKVVDDQAGLLAYAFRSNDERDKYFAEFFVVRLGRYTLRQDIQAEEEVTPDAKAKSFFDKEAMERQGKELNEALGKVRAQNTLMEEYEDMLVEFAMQSHNSKERKLQNLARLAKVNAEGQRDAKKLRRQVLLAAHPDKHKGDDLGKRLLEKICKAVNDM